MIQRQEGIHHDNDSEANKRPTAKAEAKGLSRENPSRRKKFVYIGIFFVAFLLGVIAMYVGGTYHAINSVASLEEAPFMQGYMLGIGTGMGVMYQHYYCPDIHTMAEFQECVTREGLQNDIREAITTSPLTYEVQRITQEYGLTFTDEGKDTILEWIYQSEERTEKGIFGFTVPQEEDDHWKELYCR